MLIKQSTWSHFEIGIGGRIHDIKIGNSSFERVEDFKYLGTTLTNQDRDVWRILANSVMNLLVP
jgi:hypothetical protein